jgi:hypothetical protein
MHMYIPVSDISSVDYTALSHTMTVTSVSLSMPNNTWTAATPSFSANNYPVYYTTWGDSSTLTTDTSSVASLLTVTPSSVDVTATTEIVITGLHLGMLCGELCRHMMMCVNLHIYMSISIYTYLYLSILSSPHSISHVSVSVGANTAYSSSVSPYSSYSVTLDSTKISPPYCRIGGRVAPASMRGRTADDGQVYAVSCKAPRRVDLRGTGSPGTAVKVEVSTNGGVSYLTSSLSLYYVDTQVQIYIGYHWCGF